MATKTTLQGLGTLSTLQGEADRQAKRNGHSIEWDAFKPEPHKAGAYVVHGVCTRCRAHAIVRTHPQGDTLPISGDAPGGPCLRSL